MAGKAQLPKTSVDRIVKDNIERKKQFGRERSLFAGIPQILAVNGVGVSHKTTGGIVPQSMSLPTSGGPMIGPLALHPVSTTLSSGVLDIGTTGDSFSSRVIALGQASPDNLCRIAGAAHAGQILFLQAVASYPIVLKHLTDEGTAVGNIYMPSGSDYTVDGKEIVLLQWDTINPPAGTEYGQWTLVATSGGGSGANTSLSNLSGVAINTTLLPDTANSYDIGSGSAWFGHGYMDNLTLMGSNSPALNVVTGTTTLGGQVSITGRVSATGGTGKLGAEGVSEVIGLSTKCWVYGGSSTPYELGTKGTLTSPYDESTTFPSSQSTLDDLFGDAAGSIGVYEDTNGTANYKVRFYYKGDDGWYQVSGSRV